MNKKISALFENTKRILHPTDPDQPRLVGQFMKPENIQKTANLLKIPMEELRLMPYDRVMYLTKFVGELLSDKQVEATAKYLGISVEKLRAMRYDNVMALMEKKEAINLDEVTVEESFIPITPTRRRKRREVYISWYERNDPASDTVKVSSPSFWSSLFKFRRDKYDYWRQIKEV